MKIPTMNLAIVNTCRRLIGDIKQERSVKKCQRKFKDFNILYYNAHKPMIHNLAFFNILHVDKYTNI